MAFILVVVVVVQGYLIFNGRAIIGENSSFSSDRIVKIPTEYIDAANFLNKNSFPYGYIMPIPSEEFGHYRLEQHKRYIGQDILPKLTYLPFIYMSTSTSMSAGTYTKLSGLLEQKQITNFSEFPIKYIVVRNDTQPTNNEKILIAKITKLQDSVFKNSLFQVYKNTNTAPLIQAENTSFMMINPIKYRIAIKSLRKEQKIIFAQSFNQNWVLYPMVNTKSFTCEKYFSHKPSGVKECNREKKFIESDELGYIFNKPIFSNTHALNMGYSNSWTLSPSTIKNELDKKFYTVNQDGSINLDMILYSKTQTLFYAGAMTTAIYLLIIVSYIYWHDLYKVRRIKK